MHTISADIRKADTQLIHTSILNLHKT